MNKNYGLQIVIRDPVVGDINIDNELQKIIDDLHFQKLRYIKQLGFSYLVYPGANHTRFEHSLGAMQITREIANNIGLKDIEELECAALLHDIGHCAFSHYSDQLLKKYLKTDHEKLGKEIIINSSIKDKIQNSTMNYKKVLKYYNGEHKGAIITGAFGSDRIDYLLRDSYYTGVNYGMIDYKSLISNVNILNNKLVLCSKGIGIGEHFLLARYFMYRLVYLHHAIVISENIYEKAVEWAIMSGKLDANELKNLNDYQMLSKLMSINESKIFISKLLTRNLFKRAYDGYIKKRFNLLDIKSKIKSMGINDSDYVISLLKIKNSDDIAVIDSNNNIINNLSKISEIVNSLNKILIDNQRLIIACDKKDIAKLKGIIPRALQDL
ncbi:MAG: HD domain-containing protein [Candidatus Marsarchaeota archaeon]|jgi:HD superfamily phosphohydrolase|nr:HD domain-containing protein [Candidatus Marsarchaeota archaeon]